MAKPSISMPDWMREGVDNRLIGHTDRSKWVQQAILERFAREEGPGSERARDILEHRETEKVGEKVGGEADAD